MWGIPIASKYQQDMERRYKEAFGKLGQRVEVILADSREQMDKPENLRLLEKIDGLFITGGDQVRLKAIVEDTKFCEVLKQKYVDEDFVIAGTSAGAMILSEYMINYGRSEESLIKGLVKLTRGLNFLPGTIIDTHFLKRGRFARLTEALLQRDQLIGIGISEDTALIITDENQLRAIGSGTVTIIDNSEIKNTNYQDINVHDPIYLENLRVHILAAGTAFLLNEKRFDILQNKS